jgi:hypothetical protein
MTRLSLALAASLTIAAPAAAQVTTIDEGSFTITRAGTTIGRERFRIVSTPGASGASLVATATVSYDERRLAPALRTDQAGTPVAYQVEVRVGGEMRENLKGQVGRGRFSARTQTPSGESTKEYIVADGALILDEDVFHQYYFLARREAGSVPVVVPRRNVQLSANVVSLGEARITIGGTPLAARRLALTAPGSERREIWVDAEGRVLRVEIPERGVVALRDDPPR